MLDSFSPRKVLTTLVLGAGLVAAQFPPQGQPQGQPQFAPQGPPQGQFQGPPQGQFQGPPQGQAQGPPQGAPQGAPQGQAALQTITGFGEVYNTQLKLQAYIPSNLPASPAIILALHMCGGTGEQYFQQTNYKSLADQKGVVVLYPSSPKDSNCWDVASKQSLTHDGKGDSQALINMVDWAIKQFKADPKKVFVTGSSSGCMMTNVMAATYPDRFAAATCYSGVAAGCMDGAPGSSPSSSGRVCSDGKVRKSGEEWAAQVRAMYPGYKGAYPKFKTFHGTADYFVFYQNFLEQVKEWSTIHGVQSTGKQTDGKGYTTETFGDGSKFVSVSAAGVGHTVPVHPELDFQWFGLN